MKEREDYDDSAWSEEELLAAAWEAGKCIGWEDMDEYDDIAETAPLSPGLQRL